MANESILKFRNGRSSSICCPSNFLSLLWFLNVVAAAASAVDDSNTFIEPGRRRTGPEENDRFFEHVSVPDDSSRTWIQFVLNFAVRSQWDSIVFFFSDYSELSIELTPIIFKHFNSNGKLVSVYTTSRSHLPRSILHGDRKLGIVYYCDVPDEDFLGKVSELHLFDSYRSWLFVEPERVSGKQARLGEILSGLNLGLDANVVLAKIERKSGGAPPAAASPTSASPTAAPSLAGVSGSKKGNRLGRDKRNLSGDLAVAVRLTQVYKAAKTENETLTIDLGFWDVPNGLFRVKQLVHEEYRWNLGGYKILVGVKNSTRLVPKTSPTADRFAIDGETDEEKSFMELFWCLMTGMNASYELVSYQKLGWRNEEGGWTHLLGGVVDESVEFALETIDVNADRSGDMFFTHAILTTMTNIYFHRPDSGGMRDIFLAPFSPNLVLCVLLTSFLMALAMISITVVYHRVRSEEKPGSDLLISLDGNSQKAVTLSRPKETRRWKVSDAVLWSVSILCMQGSQWHPKLISGNLLLINSLLFALVIYNSFAAFITSVLSVTNVKIKDLKDLAESDFAFGYTLGNADELFLRTVNNTLLRELYFKGLRENDGVSDPIVGMHRAAKGKYAFFVGARTARRALRKVVAHDKRCQFLEMYLTMTKNHASIPMRRKSSLKKIVNLKIIRMMESGILQRFQNLILPSMPRCVETTTFNSASLADVYSAFFVLGGGWMASAAILLFEMVWSKRSARKKSRRKTIDRSIFDLKKGSPEIGKGFSRWEGSLGPTAFRRK